MRSASSVRAVRVRAIRKKVMMAGVFAAILAIAGCAFNGPSKSDVASVEEALSVMPQGWALNFVDGSISSSEGLAKDLWISVRRTGDLSADALATMLGAVVDAVPSGARYQIKIVVTLDSADTPRAHIEIPAMELGLRDNGVGGAFDHGEIYTTRAQLEAALDKRS